LVTIGEIRSVVRRVYFYFPTNLKYFEKSIAINLVFDNFTAPRRPKGRQDSMFANR